MQKQELDFSKYINIPWLSRGRSPNGVDCWGLVVLFYEKEFGIKLPRYDGMAFEQNSCGEIAHEMNLFFNGWQQVDKPEPGDCVLLNLYGAPTHIGIVKNKTHMLHISGPTGSIIEKFSGIKWGKRIEGFYRNDNR